MEASVDNTDRHLEKMLRLANFTIERAGTPIVWVDSTAHFARVNEAACRCFGYSSEEFLRLTAQDIAPQLPPTVWPHHWADLKRLQFRTFSGQFRKRSREEFPVEVEENFIRFEGVEYSCSFIKDMTQHFQTQDALQQALDQVQMLKERLEAENIYLMNEIKLSHNFEEILTGNPIFMKALQQVEQVAPTDASVLILGETGVGKELVARAIHNLSNRRERPLIRLNCAALPATLMENELFGHEKGAFTGAHCRKPGRFDLADGGTIFLDEIGDLPLELQSKLLRVLQEGEFERLGGSDTIKVNVRILAATHVDLEALIAAGRFRSDLYYRLNVFPLRCPPLRERKEDIPMLVNHFVKIFCEKNGKKIELVPRQVMASLESYPWPGNIRELQNVIERAVIISQGNKLEIDSLPKMVVAAEAAGITPLEETERAHILRALESTGWRVGGSRGAAEILGIKRTTLQARMRKLGIQRHGYPHSAGLQ
jgi:PAS domain S-box-containing protein